MATELGKAYVQIIPSAKGISGAISSELGGSTMTNAGKTAGLNIAGAIKGAIAAAGIGTAIKSALEAGGNLQQSFGGLDTIYGDAADAAKEYAAAASEAGISANTYAEQAVSFGAALKQAYGGDTTKAMEAANTAILDMADNSAKMGTDITSIQNAYQGFAKQNYTMLDNLKIGYGGTKEEMQRLLADAQKLSGVEYNIDNLGDVYDAIHVIQEDLGLTGVAADEASTTFTGSMGAMKAAAENLLANVALGQDLGPSLTALGTSVSNFFFNNLIPMLGNILASIPQLVTGIIGQIIQNVPNMISAIISTMQSIADSISNFKLDGVGLDMISGLMNGILSSIPGLIDTATQLIRSFITFVMQNMPAILEAGVNILLSLVNGIISNLPQIVASAAQMVATFLSTIATNLPKILEQGITIIVGLVAGLIQAIPMIIAAIPKIISSIVTTFASYDWGSIGINLIKGIAEGIKNAGGIIVDAAKNAAKAAWEAAKDFLGINSPATKGIYIGQMLDEGFALGISDNSGLVDKAITDLSSNATSQLQFATNGEYSINNSTDKVELLINMLSQYLPEIAAGNDIILDGDSLVKKTASRMDMALGTIQTKRERGVSLA